MKKCGRCQIIKEDYEFSNGQIKRSGGRCRSCNTKVCAEYRKKNPDKIKKYNKEYNKVNYQNNKEKNKENKKKYYKNNKEIILQKNKEYYKKVRDDKLKHNKEYYKNNKNKILKSVKNYAINHKDEIKEYHNKYYKEKRKNDLGFRIKTNISANISFYLKSNGLSKNKKSTLKYLPYTIRELERYLESLFESWMNWQNYGKYGSKTWNDNDPSTWTWQIDHIIPHSTFKYTSIDSEEFKKCWALNNLRPYSAKQNFMDGVNRVRHK